MNGFDLSRIRTENAYPINVDYYARKNRKRRSEKFINQRPKYSISATDSNDHSDKQSYEIIKFVNGVSRVSEILMAAYNRMK